MAFDFACPDWFDRLKRGETPIADLPLDPVAAENAVAVFNKLRLPDVPGQPELREAAGEWMRDVVRAVFGSMSTSTGVPEVRQVGEVFILVPKKNAKTTSAAAIALTFMLLNQRHHADMLIIGPTQKISDVAFEQAKGMIAADEYLQRRLHVQDHKKTIVDRVTKTRLMVRTFGMDVLTGAKPIFCLIDEIHILGMVVYAADVIRQIRGGMLPFPEAVLIMITTQSDHPPQGLFKRELDYARGVRDGRITDGVRLLPVLYEFPAEIQTADDEPWRDPAIWHLVTPNLGLSIVLERLVEGYQRAVEDGQGELIAWATQHLNIEMGLALHADRWPGTAYWQAARMEGLTLDRLMDLSEVCTIAVDGGGMDDICGLAVIGRHRETGAWMHWARAWAQPEVFERRKGIAAALRDFIADGDLIVRESESEIGQDMAEICLKLAAAGLLPEKHGIGYDDAGPKTGIEQIQAHPELASRLVGVPQGYKLQRPVLQLPNKLKAKEFLHCGQPIMAWAAGNAKMELVGSNWLVKKQNAGASKIDPLMATFDAAYLMYDNPVAADQGSYLDDAELMVL